VTSPDDHGDEQTQSDSPSQRVKLPRPSFLSVVPRFEEMIQPEFMRLSGKVRVLVGLTMIALDAIGLYDATPVGLDTGFYRLFMAWNLPVLGLTVLLGWRIWRGAHPIGAMFRMTYLCMLLEVSSTVGCIWLFGTTSSYMIVFGMLLVLVYRTFFNFKIGLAAFSLMLLGYYLVVGLELAGAIPHAPGVLNALEPSFDKTLTISVVMTIMLGLSFYVANIAVARLLFRDQTIRVLRANLAAVERGKRGRHSGRTLCDRYRLSSLLGTGGMGEVYRGSHLRTRREVAVKILHQQYRDDSNLLARFRREATITGSLGSPNIVEIIDIDQDEELPFLVFELLEGQDLAGRINQHGLLPPVEVAQIVDQAASGLQVAHDAGVVHRDLKPENLFLARQEGGEVVKILDFGISKTLGGNTTLTGEMSMLGTPDFMSPEQAMGMTSRVDHRADIYAMGAITYNALTGERPFAAPSVPVLLWRICDEEPVPLVQRAPEAGEDVAAVVAIAMAKRPHERYDSVEAFARELTEAIDGKLSAEVRQRARALHRGKTR
jgi:serine/threonine-protein kinase